jgi:hypothetical protein
MATSYCFEITTIKGEQPTLPYLNYLASP